MRVFSDNYKNRMRAPVKRLDVRIVEDVESGGIELNYNGDLMGVKLSSEGNFLSSVVKKAVVSASGDKTGLLNKKFNVWLDLRDVSVANGGDRESVSLGRFKVKEVNFDVEKNTSSLNMFDEMADMAVDEFSSGLGWPSSVKELIKEIAGKYGLSVDENKLSKFINIDLELVENYWAKINKTTYQKVLREIVEAIGAVGVRISGKELEFVDWGVVNADKLSEANLKAFKIGGKWGGVNSVVLSRMPQNDNVAMKKEGVFGDDIFEIKIINNEIVDDRRAELVEGLFNKYGGNAGKIAWWEITAETEGHGVYEGGDLVAFRIGGVDYVGLVSSYSLDLEGGGIKEKIISKIVDKTKTDYTKTGGVLKTIYETEIKTDRQGQEITSVVSKQVALDSKISEEFVKITQNINNVNYSVMRANGANLLKNTGFYSVDKDKRLNFWDIVGVVEYYNSSEAGNYGSLSKRAVRVKNGVRVKQAVAVVKDEVEKSEDEKEYYALSFMVKKGRVGKFWAKVWNKDNLLKEYVLNEGDNAVWSSVKLEGMLAVYGDELVVEFGYEDNVNDSRAEIADIMLANNKGAQVWAQAQGEIANTQVVIDEKGIVVNSSVNEGDYTAITPLEFSGYSRKGDRVERIFTLNKDTTEVKKLKAEDELNMLPIKIVAIKNGGGTTGWAFVQSGNGGE